MSRWLRVLWAAVALSLVASGVLAQQVTVGSGHVSSIYYKYGEILCDLVQSANERTCENIETKSFLENLAGLTEGEFTFALISSEWLDEAYEGYGRREKDGPMPTLRAVLALPSTVVTVLARPDSNIDGPLDLKGSRIRTAPLRTIMPFRWWLKETNWQEEDFRNVRPMGFENSLIQLCADEVDALVYLDGHPGLKTEIATAQCELDLVAMGDVGVANVIEKDRTLMSAEIPGGLYPRHPQPTKTFGTYVVLVTTENVPKDTVYGLVKSVFMDFEVLRAGHAALSAWQRHHVKGLTFPAPLHTGAELFYLEEGLR